MITMRSPIDGTTQEVDNADKDRLARLTEMGYLVVDKPAQTAKPKK